MVADRRKGRESTAAGAVVVVEDGEASAVSEGIPEGETGCFFFIKSPTNFWLFALATPIKPRHVAAPQ